MENSENQETDFYTLEITGETTVKEAIQILKDRADRIANSKEAEKFNKENPSWSSLFREEYAPYRHAVQELERALEINEWLNGKYPENEQITVIDAFKKMTDQERLSLFHKRVNSNVATIFDDCLRVWWLNRY